MQGSAATPGIIPRAVDVRAHPLYAEKAWVIDCTIYPGLVPQESLDEGF